MALVLTLMLCSLALQFPTPLIVRKIFDVVLPAKDAHKFLFWAFVLLGISIGRIITNLYTARLLAKNRSEVSLHVREIIFNKILNARMDFFDHNKVGYTKSRIDEDVDQVDSMIYEAIPNLVIQTITFLGGLVICWLISPTLTIVVLASIAPYFIAFNYYSRKTYSLTLVNQETWATFQGFIVEYLTKIPLLKILMGMKPVRKEFQASIVPALMSNRKIEETQAHFEAVMGLLTAIIPLLVLLVGILQTIELKFTVGGIIAFNTAMQNIYGPTTTLVHMNINSSKTLACLSRIFKILDLPEEQDAFGTKHIEQLYSIEFKEAELLYDGERGMKPISLTVKKGNSLCIIGVSGSGKSTLGHLLVGLRTPTRGSVLVNGLDHREYDIRSLRKIIGYVPQETLLFSGTIRDNLFFENSKIGANELVKIAQLEPWISSLPKGFETRIQDTSMGVSGGERQRLAIARALTSKPDLLILDEITSALDPENEERVFRNILQLPWKPMVICITHRREFTTLFDQVIEMS